VCMSTAGGSNWAEQGEAAPVVSISSSFEVDDACWCCFVTVETAAVAGTEVVLDQWPDEQRELLSSLSTGDMGATAGSSSG
jgi:predicted HAD superfamily phosphohydrolase